MPSSIPNSIINGALILVNWSKKKVDIIRALFNKLWSIGRYIIMAAAMTIPELAAAIPSKDALTIRYLFKLS